MFKLKGVVWRTFQLFLVLNDNYHFILFNQLAALGAISNIVVEFSTKRSIFIGCGGVKELVRLSKSMDLEIRLNALWALRNLMFLTNIMCKEAIFMELTASLLASLVCGTVELCLSIFIVDFILCLINVASPVYVQILSLPYRSMLWPLCAILLMDVRIQLSMRLLKMPLY